HDIAHFQFILWLATLLIYTHLTLSYDSVDSRLWYRL
ncbi:MAG: hypothetical protein ACI8XX_000691, partial [Polaribacter sp.]